MTDDDRILALETLLRSDGWDLFATEATERADSLEREILTGDMAPERYIQATAALKAARGLLAWPQNVITMLRDRQTQENAG